MLKSITLIPITSSISTSWHLQTRLNFHAEDCQLFPLSPPSLHGLRNWRNKSGTDIAHLGGKRLGKYSHLLWGRFPQSPELRHTRVTFIYFLFQRCQLFPGTEVSRTGFCKAGGLQLPPCRPAVGAQQPAQTDEQGEQGQQWERPNPGMVTCTLWGFIQVTISLNRSLVFLKTGVVLWIHSLHGSRKMKDYIHCQVSKHCSLRKQCAGRD